MRCAADAKALGRDTAALARELRWQAEAARLRELIEMLLASRSASLQDAAGRSRATISCTGD
jgi:hypothetical protein